VGDFPKKGFEKLVSSPTPELRVERIPKDFEQPYVQQWNLNIQRSLGRYSFFRVAYVGSHGVHLSTLVEDANLIIPVTLPDDRLFFPADGQRVNSELGMIRDRLFEGHSFYHGLQLELVRRWHSGLHLQGSYTFSRSIDDSSGTFAQTESANSIGVPLNGNSRFNRGLSNHHLKHRLIANAGWSLPSPVESGFTSALFGGWQVGLITVYTSGLPFTASLEYDAARKIAQGLGAHLEKLSHLVEVKGNTAMLLSAGARTRYLFGKDAAEAPKGKRKKKSKGFRYKTKELSGFNDLEGRLIVRWGEGTRSWAQWLHRHGRIY